MIHYLSLKKYWVKNKQGYTLVELMIAIQLTFLIVGFVYYSFLSSQQLLKSWQNRYRTENDIAMISQLCSKLLSELHIIQVAEKHKLSGLNLQGEFMELSLNENFKYNDNEILFQCLKVQKGHFIYTLENPEDRGLLISKQNVTPAEIPFIIGLELKLIVESEHRKLTIKIFNRFTGKR